MVFGNIQFLVRVDSSQVTVIDGLVVPENTNVISGLKCHLPSADTASIMNKKLFIGGIKKKKLDEEEDKEPVLDVVNDSESDEVSEDESIDSCVDNDEDD